MSLLLDPEARPVVAHRGDSAHAPENTLESFGQAVALGADALECDVHLSRDGHVVVIHDPTVDRTTNASGAVASRTLAELQQLDAGFRFSRDVGRTFPWRGRGVVIPTLEAVLTAFPSTPVIVEVKTPSASERARQVLLRFDPSRCLVGAFEAESFAPFTGSGIARTASQSDVIRLFARALLPWSPHTLPYQALCIPPVERGIPIPVLRFSRMGHAAGIPTHVWVVDEPARALRYWRAGVNAMITNDPALLLAAAGRVSARLHPSPV
ncbi:MAG: glycerophosphodiester phosphodiesterase family protein [Gemmatimonadales bacterium]